MALKDVLKNIGQKVKKVTSSVISNAKSFITGVTQIATGNFIGGVGSIAGGINDVISDVNGTSNNNKISTPKAESKQVEKIPLKYTLAVNRGLADNDYTKSTDELLKTISM